MMLTVTKCTPSMAAVKPMPSASRPKSRGKGINPKSERTAVTAPERPGTLASVFALRIGQNIAKKKMSGTISTILPQKSSVPHLKEPGWDRTFLDDHTYAQMPGVKSQSG
jgi:hypothetical protein